MPNYLISYVDAEKNHGHEDPMLNEFTYGDVKANGKKLLGLKKGDLLFFHKAIFDKRYITAYYWVEEADLVHHLIKDQFITEKYNNPHIKKQLDQLDSNEVIVFGNPIRSRLLEKPLEITPDLLNQLSRKANLNPNQSPLAAISSALRTWKVLTSQDVDFLLEQMNENEESGRLSNTTLSTEEVFQVLEKDIEKFIATHPEILGDEYILEKQQYVFSDNSRLDLLLYDKNNDCRVVIEVKKGPVGREAKQQIKHYMKLCKNELGFSDIKGIIVCAGILPYFESELLNAKKDNIFVKTFGWNFNIK